MILTNGTEGSLLDLSTKDTKGHEEKIKKVILGETLCPSWITLGRIGKPAGRVGFGGARPHPTFLSL